jgi:mono/diheme cytochrome c family protein
MSTTLPVTTRIYRDTLLFLVSCLIALSARAGHETVLNDDSQYHRGVKIFADYCSRCHGVHADGRGRAMPLYVKLRSAHPSNFQLKVYALRPKQYLADIVRDGGEKHSLSGFMPPFGEELTETQINDVVYFIQNVSLNPGDNTPENFADAQKEK